MIRTGGDQIRKENNSSSFKRFILKHLHFFASNSLPLPRDNQIHLEIEKLKDIALEAYLETKFAFDTNKLELECLGLEENTIRLLTKTFLHYTYIYNDMRLKLMFEFDILFMTKVNLCLSPEQDGNIAL